VKYRSNHGILVANRSGALVSPLAVSRLLLVFDYMVNMMSGEKSSHFEVLLQQVRLCVKCVFKEIKHTIGIHVYKLCNPLILH